MAATTGRSAKAIASLVLGVIGLVVVPIVFSTLAIVLGLVALRETAIHPELGGRNLALGGLVLGIVGLVAGIVVGIGILS
jgi:uncharacterized protein DUF4190